MLNTGVRQSDGQGKASYTEIPNNCHKKILFENKYLCIGSECAGLRPQFATSNGSRGNFADKLEFKRRKNFDVGRREAARVTADARGMVALAETERRLEGKEQGKKN